MTETLRLGFLVFPEVQQLDLTGPYEVFASLPDVEISLLWKSTEPVRSATGLRLIPDALLEGAGQYDLICVPGGIGVNALLEDGAVLEFLRAQAAGARYVTSVCTGALVLGAAGLLRGRRATTHWASMDFLAAFGAIAVTERVVLDGNLFTGGGVTAGIDFALTIAAELRGQAAAEAVQLQLEYAPAPPFTAGTPERAPPDIRAAVAARGAATKTERARIIQTLTA